MAQSHEYNYVATAQKPTAARLSVVGCFTAPGVLNLIIAKYTRLEICVIGEEGLEGVFDVPIYGRVSNMGLFSVEGEATQRLFLLTEKYQFAVLKFDPDQGELVTCASGDVSDRVGRPVQGSQLCEISPRGDVIALHLYDGHIKLIPIDAAGVLGEAYNILVSELVVIDMKFLDSPDSHVLGIIYEAYGRKRHFGRYALRADSLVPLGEEGGDAQVVSELTSFIIPVAGTPAGALIPDSRCVAYADGEGAIVSAVLPSTLITAFGVIDHASGRYLLGDHRGALFLVLLEKEDGRVAKLHVEQLGRTSQASTISYLDSGIVYIGSRGGDCQLIRLHAEPPNAAEPDNFIEVLDSTPNLGPIVDFTVMDLDRQGQGQVVTCSGTGWDGSLRIVRSGVGVIEQATVELPELRDVWSLRGSFDAEHDLFLVLGFSAGTRVLGLNADEELEEVEVPGLSSQEQTLLCANLLGSVVCQVTPRGVNLADAASGQRLDTWHAPDDQPITLASANATQIAVVVGTSSVVLLALDGGKLTELDARLDLMSEISCVDITPFDVGATSSDWLLVGDWSMNLLLYSLPGMALVGKESLGGDVIPRSVLMANLAGRRYVFCGLGDGHLINYRLEGTELVDRKRLALGTKPIRLRTFRIRGETHVFCPSDRPTIIHANNQKLSYSNLNENEVTSMTSFHSSAFPDSLAIAKGDALTIGTIDRIQKLHVRTVPLQEQPRRIAHQEATKTFAVITTQSTMAGVRDQGTDSLRLLNEQTFETLDRFAMEPKEMACSLLSTTLGVDASRVFYVVGTAMIKPDDRESDKGRLLVFEVEREKLRLVYSHPTKGAVYSLVPLTAAAETHLVAGVNSRVQVYSWIAEADGRVALQPEGVTACSVLALYLDAIGSTVLVGDLMKSMHTMSFIPEVKALKTEARDFRPMWITAIKMLDENTYLGAENSCNLLSLRRNLEAHRDFGSSRLESVGLFHTGEFINRFRSGSLVMKLPDSELSQVPMTLFGTVSGVIGLVASLPQQQFQFLEQLEVAMRKVVRGVGGFSHSAWRAFSNQYMPTGVSTGFVDGDLIEQFLDLRREEQLVVLGHLSPKPTLEEVIQLVEELSRLH